MFVLSTREESCALFGPWRLPCCHDDLWGRPATTFWPLRKNFLVAKKRSRRSLKVAAAAPSRLSRPSPKWARQPPTGVTETRARPLPEL